MAETKAERLRAARQKAGYESASAAAQAFGWTESAYRHHENGTRSFGPDAARKYGRAFKVKPGWLLLMPDVDDAPPRITDTDKDLTVDASVAAGIWRETEQWEPERRFTIEDRPSPLPHAKRMGLTVEGFSMDVHYEPGTVLDCVSIFKGGVEPQSGDHVIVERVKPDGLRELTVKEFLVEDGRYFLLPKSTKPEFQQRIEIGRPDRNVINGEQVNVIAFVVGSVPPRALSILERLGKIRRGPNNDT